MEIALPVVLGNKELLMGGNLVEENLVDFYVNLVVVFIKQDQRLAKVIFVPGHKN